MEVKIMKAADHPNIIKLLELYDNQDWFYLVLEKC